MKIAFWPPIIKYVCLSDKNSLTADTVNVAILIMPFLKKYLLLFCVGFLGGFCLLFCFVLFFVVFFF